MKLTEQLKFDNAMNAPVKQMTDAQLQDYLLRVRGLYAKVG